MWELLNGNSRLFKNTFCDLDRNVFHGVGYRYLTFLGGMLKLMMVAYRFYVVPAVF